MVLCHCRYARRGTFPLRLPFSKKSITPVPNDDAAILEALAGPSPGANVTPAVALTCTPVAAAVRLISEACAVLDVNIVDGDKPVTSHPALTLLRGQVNNWTSGFELRRDLVAETLLHDSGAMAWVNRIDGNPVEIINYKRGTIQVQYEETREPLYRLSGRPVPASDILHLRGPLEKCPVSLAREAIGAAIAMEAHAGRLFQRGARPGGVIEFPQRQVGVVGISPDAEKRMKAGWQAAHEGPSNAGKTALLYDGATFKQMQLSSVDAQFLELRRFQIEEIARAFGMSASQLGDLTRSSYANASQKQLELIVYAIEPWLCAIEAAFDRALLTAEERERGLRFKIDRDDLTRASLTERATAINSLRASEVLSADEGRSWLGLDKRADGKGGEYSNPNINLKSTKVPINE